jgi:hypothetical protein
VTNAPPRQIIQRDDGMWSIGLGDDAPGPFETRRHAEAVAKHTGDPPKKRRRPPRANRRPHFVLDRAAAKTSYADPKSQSRPAPALARWYAITANSLVLGTFKSRLEAAQASGRCV